MYCGGKPADANDSVRRTEDNQTLSGQARRLFEEQRFPESLNAARQALEQMRDDDVSADAPACRDCALLVAWNLHQLRRYDDCRRHLVAMVDEQFVAGDDPEAELIELWIRWSESRYAEVVEAADRRLDARVTSLDALTAEFLYLRASACNRLGEMNRARDDGESALALFRMLGQQKEEAEVANLLGMIAWEQSRFDEAVRWLEQSLERNRELGLARRIGENCGNLGIVHYKQGSYTAALAALGEAIATDRTLPSPNLVCRARIARGNVHRLLGDYREARRELMAAYSVATERRLPREEALALEFLGDVCRDEGRAGEARRYYDRGLKIARLISPEGDLVAELLRRDGECLIKLGRCSEASETLLVALDLVGRLEDEFEEGAVLRARALAAAATADLPGAEKLFTRALAIFDRIKAEHQAALTHFRAARVLAESRPDVAMRHALVARHIFESHDGEFWSARVEDLLETLTAPSPVVMEATGVSAGREAKNPIRKPGARGAALPVDRGIVAVSDPMRRCLRESEDFAVFPEPVLVTGETGTGKEVIARHIHDSSPRRAAAFVAVNCAAIPASLFEREFFGHTRGAFSGAEEDRVGFVAEAHNGTLFLDEIGDLPLDLQPKLLRLLQEGTYCSLGDPRERHADIRLVAATNSDLETKVESGEFRRDLYYRLEVLSVELPPLRERPADILPLLQRYLTQYCGRRVKVADFFDDASLTAMRRWEWRGNVREVIMIARRAHIAMQSRGFVDMQLGSGAESVRITGGARRRSQGPVSSERLARLLAENSGNKAKTARRLGVSRQTLYRWLEENPLPNESTGSATT